MTLQHTERLDRFIAAGTDYAAAKAVIYGIPMDFTTSYRPGTRFGPHRIREASYGIEEFSYHQLDSLANRLFYDAGDVSAIFGDPAGTLNRALEAARQIVADGKLPIMVGGEHLCTLPAFRAVAEKYGQNLVLLQFDAHADLRQDYMGNPLSHACVMRRCVEVVPPANLYQFGIRSGTEDEYAFGREHCHLYPAEVLGPVKQVLPELQGRPVYVTIDIDVVDPAFAPGTGTPEPGGISSAELLAVVRALRGLQVVGFDVVEVAPTLDHSDRTAVLGALLIREAILAFT